MKTIISDGKAQLHDVQLEPEMNVADKWYYPVLAPFSKHYSRKVLVAQASTADRTVLDHMVTVEFPKVVFTKNSKAACTSVSHALYFLSSSREYDGNIHHESQILSQGRYHWDTILARRDMSDYKTFTFVRHPIDRLESAFRNFVIEGRNNEVVHHAAGFEKFGCSKDKSESDNFDAFLDYVEASFEISRIRTDRHWRLQVDNIGLGRFSYDFIGRVENLQDDMRKLFTMAGVDDQAIEQAIYIRKNASRTSGRIANKAQCARIRKLYAADFEAFGYD